MPVVLLRVDERLIHGQVVVGWGERLDVERIIVVDDELSGSAWEQDLYRLGVPASVQTDFLDVRAARARFPALDEAAERVLVLVRNVETLGQMAAGGLLEGREINLGGIHYGPGRTRVLPYIFLSQVEKDDLRTIEETGARVVARDLPATRAVSLQELLGEA